MSDTREVMLMSSVTDLRAVLGLCARPGCGRPESEHSGPADELEARQVLAALGGACTRFLASRIETRVFRETTEPGGEVCRRCGLQGHLKPACPW